MNMVHVTIQTSKFEEEIRFYEKYVGLTIRRDMRSAGKDLVFLGENAGSTMVENIHMRNLRKNCVIPQNCGRKQDTGIVW